MKSVWHTLDIEQTSDSKSIKRAYAKKLKLVRPDEKPEEFQQLHIAYKQALQYAAWEIEQATNASEAAENNTGPESEITQQHEITDSNEDFSMAGSLSNTSSAVDINQVEALATLENTVSREAELQDSAQAPPQVAQQEADAERLIYQAEIDRLMQKVEECISDVSRYHLEKWNFLLESKYILDSEFCWNLGYAVFVRLARYYNEKKYREDGDFRITLEVLRFLDSIFHWTVMDIDFSEFFTDEYGLKTFNTLRTSDEHVANVENKAIEGLRGAKSVKTIKNESLAPLKEYFYGSDISRALASIIDFVIILPVITAITWFNEAITHYHYNNLYLIIGVYLTGVWLFETSRYRATPGKLLMGLRVITSDQKRIGRLRGFLRTAIFGVTMIGFYLTIIINRWMANQYIHDRLTGSRVLDLRRSQKKAKTGL